jgi:hypothetical protein
LSAISIGTLGCAIGEHRRHERGEEPSIGWRGIGGAFSRGSRDESQERIGWGLNKESHD